MIVTAMHATMHERSCAHFAENPRFPIVDFSVQLKMGAGDTRLGMRSLAMWAKPLSWLHAVLREAEAQPPRLMLGGADV